MNILIPWSVLSGLTISKAMRGLLDAVADRDPHSVRAYVALGMLRTRFYRLLRPEDMEIHLSEAAAESLALCAMGQEEPSWKALAHIIYIQLEAADGPDEQPEPRRPDVPTVRESRRILDGLS